MPLKLNQLPAKLHLGFLGGLVLASALASANVPAIAQLAARISSVGALGIDADRLHTEPYRLTGRKIAIGQVEIGRPALFGLDKVATSNRALHIGRLFYQGSVATADQGWMIMRRELPALW